MILENEVFGRYLRGRSPEEELRRLEGQQKRGEILNKFGNVKMSDSISTTAVRQAALLKLATHEMVSDQKNEKPYTVSEAVGGWRKVGENYKTDNCVFNSHRGELNGYNLFMKATDETLSDSVFDLERLLVDTFGKRYGVELEKAVISGNGNGMPHGFIHDADAVAAAGAAVSYADLEKLFLTLDAKYISRSAWLCNRDTFAAIAALADAHNNSILTTKTSIDDDAPDGYLLGRPVYFATLPPEKPVAFGEFSHYHIFEGPMFVERLNELYADRGIVGFKFSQLVDGKLLKADSVICLEM